ncbi:hypothetical protein RFI_22105, partial [Reticulomyxa filosa]
MLQINVEESEEKKDTKITNCYDKGWIEWCEQGLLETDTCFKCGQVVKDAMELTCEGHVEGDDVLIIGEECLNKHLQENSGKCPSKNGHRSNEGSKMTSLNDGCQYKGKIKDLQEHLEKSCPLSPIDCPFRKYGCKDIIFRYNEKEHIQAKIKYHMNF